MLTVYNFSSIINQTSNLNVSDLSTNVQFRLLIKTYYIGYILSYSRNFSDFMELEGSSTLSQEPATFLCPEQDQSTPCLQCPFLKINFDNILPYTRRLANQTSVCSSPVTHTCEMSNPSHSPWSSDTKNTWQEVQIIKLLFKQSPLTSYLLPLRAKYIPQHSILEYFVLLGYI